MNSREAFYASEILCTKHSSYFEVYDNHFDKFKDKEIIFVEIGVFEGGSLLMWRNFFGPKARIIGIDINPNAKVMEQKGFEIFIGDQSSELFWESFYQIVGDVDIILDDGGHYFDQQIKTLEIGIKHLKDDGIIMIEDTHTSYMKSYFGPNKFSFINYTKKIIDQINFRSETIPKKGFDKNYLSLKFYESIVVFEKNTSLNLEKSFMIDNNKGKFISTFNIQTTKKDNNLKEKLKAIKILKKLHLFIVRLKISFLKPLKTISYKRYFKRFYK